MKAWKLHSFIPSGKDYALAQNFFEDLGFEKVYTDEGMSIFRNEETEFYLRNFHDKHFQENFMVTFSIEDLDGLWAHIQKTELEKRYPIKVTAPQIVDGWGKEIALSDPAGVYWHITQKPVLISSVGGTFSVP